MNTTIALIIKSLLQNESEIERVPVIVTAMFYSVASYGIIQTGNSYYIFRAKWYVPL